MALGDRRPARPRTTRCTGRGRPGARRRPRRRSAPAPCTLSALALRRVHRRDRNRRSFFISSTLLPSATVRTISPASLALSDLHSSRRRSRSSARQAPRDADARAAGHVDQVAAGQRELVGEARALAAHRILGDLDQDLLAGLEHLGDLVRARFSPSSGSAMSSTYRKPFARDRCRRRPRPCPAGRCRPCRGRCCRRTIACRAARCRSRPAARLRPAPPASRRRPRSRGSPCSPAGRRSRPTPWDGAGGRRDGGRPPRSLAVGADPPCRPCRGWPSSAACCGPPALPAAGRLDRRRRRGRSSAALAGPPPARCRPSSRRRRPAVCRRRDAAGRGAATGAPERGLRGAFDTGDRRLAGPRRPPAAARAAGRLGGAGRGGRRRPSSTAASPPAGTSPARPRRPPSRRSCAGAGARRDGRDAAAWGASPAASSPGSRRLRRAPRRRRSAPGSAPA